MTDGTDSAVDKFHNKISKKLNKKKSGISDMEQEIRGIRLAIQVLPRVL
jgi:hypothetical protein